MKRSDNLAWSQVKAGIFIIFALVIMAAGIIVMGQKTKFFVPKGQLTVIMADAAGLKQGAPVWLAGVDVGIVKQIHFAQPKQNNEVEVILQIEKEALQKVGKDSKITVKTRGLMGEKYVDITPSQFISEVPETKLYGTSMVKLDDVMQRAGTAFDRLNQIMAKVEQGEGTLGRFAKDPRLYDNLVKLSAELTSFSQNVNRGEGTLGKLARSREPYDKLVSVLNRADETLYEIQFAGGTLNQLIHDRELYDKLVALANKSNQAADDVRELNKKLTSKESTIGKLLGEREMYDRGIALIDRADKAVAGFEELAAKVNRGEGTAGKLVTDQELYLKMNQMVDSLDTLLKDIKENPKRYVKFSLF